MALDIILSMLLLVSTYLLPTSTVLSLPDFLVFFTFINNDYNAEVLAILAQRLLELYAVVFLVLVCRYAFFVSDLLMRMASDLGLVDC